MAADPTEVPYLVTPPLLVSLGLILFHDGDLEDAMVEATWIASRKRRDEGVAIVRGQTMGVLKNTFLSQYRQAITDAKLLAQLAAIESRLNAAVDLRNEIVHASWRAEHAKGRYPVFRKRIPKALVGHVHEVHASIGVPGLEFCHRVAGMRATQPSACSWQHWSLVAATITDKSY